MKRSAFHASIVLTSMPSFLREWMSCKSRGVSSGPFARTTSSRLKQVDRRAAGSLPLGRAREHSE